MGTLASSDHNLAHTSNFTNMRYSHSAMAILEHLKPIQHVNYVHTIAAWPDSLRVFFHGETIFIRYSTTMQSLWLTIRIQWSSLSIRAYLWYRKVIISFMLAITRNFIQGRHPGRYLRSEPWPILASAKQSCTALVMTTMYFTYIVTKPSMWLSGPMAVQTLGTATLMSHNDEWTLSSCKTHAMKHSA